MGKTNEKKVTVMKVAEAKKVTPTHKQPRIIEYTPSDSEGEFHDADYEEIHELMENHDLDRAEAEHVKELMDEEGLDEDEAVELKDDL